MLHYTLLISTAGDGKGGGRLTKTVRTINFILDFKNIPNEIIIVIY